MPYYMESVEGEFCVFKEGAEVPLECYADQSDAEDYLTALNIATADENYKAESDTHIPPEAVAENAQMALEVRAEKPPSQQGMTLVGLARANQLADRRPVTVATIRRMLSYFERHEVDKEGETWDEQGKGWQAWYGWGGDEGWAWAREIIAEEDSMDETKASRRHSEADMKLIRNARKQISGAIETLKELGDDGMDDDETKALHVVVHVEVSDDEHADEYVEEPSDAQMEQGVEEIVGALDDVRTMKAEEGNLDTIKSLPQSVKAIGDYMVKGKGIVYGGFDLTDDRFTPDTDLGGSRPFEGTPVFYDHAMGGIKSQIGVVKAWMPSDDGIDVEIELDRRHKYADDVMKLVEAGALGLSTGAVSHLVVREPIKGGYEIKRWHVAEISLTPTPAEPRTATEVKSAEGTASSMADASPAPDDIQTKDTESLEETKAMPQGIDNARNDEPQVKTLPAAPAENPFDSNEYYQAYKRYMNVKAPIEKADDGADVFNVLRNATKSYAVKTQTEGTNNDGGFTVPTAINRDVVARRDDMSLLGQFNFQRITTDTWKVVVPAQSTKAVAAIVGEGVTATASEPNIANTKTIQLYKDTLEFAITEELLADTASNYEQFLMNEIARAMAVSVNSFIITGTGSSQPYGIYARVTNDVTLGATSATSAQILSISTAVNGAYMTNGETGWVMRNATWGVARGLDLTNTGMLLTSMEGGVRRIESWPVALSESVQAYGVSGNEAFIFGNFGYYAFAERTAGVQIERDYNPRTGVTYMIAKWRFGGDVTQPEAFAIGKHA
jgi:HK97 family phage major capsid protein